MGGEYITSRSSFIAAWFRCVCGAREAEMWSSKGTTDDTGVCERVCVCVYATSEGRTSSRIDVLETFIDEEYNSLCSFRELDRSCPVLTIHDMSDDWGSLQSGIITLYSLSPAPRNF